MLESPKKGFKSIQKVEHFIFYRKQKKNLEI